jgi:hypothetical protein
MKRGALLEHLMPWAGLVLAGLAWFFAHQTGSISVFDDCTAGTPLFILIVNLLGIALALLGAYWSWQIWRRGEETEGRRFLGLLGLLFAGLLLFALVLQLVSGFIVPQCLA